MRHNRSRHLTMSAALALTLALLPLPAAIAQERGDDSRRASKNGRAEGTIGDASVVVTYGRPKVKGRQVWGALVPYGAVWRAGADEANTVTFSTDVEVEGNAVPAGTYSLFFLPTEDEWTVILNKVANQWGAFRYDEGQDQMRAKVEPEAADHVEELTIEVTSDGLLFRWEELAVPVRIDA
ncbi:MAG: DUF2911 domain-containing protein [Thermoanaerobaculia bacterium]|nr:DUF2911 domain-containing protein [Thermoanaerobaculia bacterium]